MVRGSTAVRLSGSSLAIGVIVIPKGAKNPLYTQQHSCSLQKHSAAPLPSVYQPYPMKHSWSDCSPASGTKRAPLWQCYVQVLLPLPIATDVLLSIGQNGGSGNFHLH